MNKDEFQTKFDKAKEQLLADSIDDDELRDFESGVWAQIAIREEYGKSKFWDRVRQFGISELPVPAAIGIVIFGIVLGTVTALARANSYDQELSALFEQKYVSAIHPIVRSESDHHSKSPSEPLKN